MTRSRVPETDQGIQSEVTVADYDLMQRFLRDRGWIETDALLKHEMRSGVALEVGFGPGYLGLEWLKKTEGTTLVGIDISPAMQALAQRNAQTYGLSARADFRLGSSDRLPFADNTFDAVFTNGSLHEWANPAGTFAEIWRVLKPAGRYYISDMRRDMNIFLQAFLWLSVQPTQMRPGLMTSIHAAYIPRELQELLAATHLKTATVTFSGIGLEITGIKPLI